MRSTTGLRTALVLLAAGAAACATAPPSRRAERDAAVRAGLRWLDRRLADPEAAEALGVDAVGIFADYAASAADPVSRHFARAAARRHARRLAPAYLARGSRAAGDLPDLLYLVVEMRELGLPTVALRERAVGAVRELPSPDSVYGLPSLAPAALDHLPEHRFFGLVLGVYAVERAAAGGIDIGVRFGLRELLAAARRRPLLRRREDPDPGGERFRDHVYRATHFAYLLCDYGRLRRTEADAPWLFDYLREVFPDVLADGDVELVAEITDVFRNLGRDETDCDLVRRGTDFLLAARRGDGSWTSGRERGDPYLALHPTWCAVMALGERRFLSGTPYGRRLEAALRDGR